MFNCSANLVKLFMMILLHDGLLKYNEVNFVLLIILDLWKYLYGFDIINLINQDFVLQDSAEKALITRLDQYRLEVVKAEGPVLPTIQRSSFQELFHDCFILLTEPSYPRGWVLRDQMQFFNEGMLGRSKHECVMLNLAEENEG